MANQRPYAFKLPASEPGLRDESGDTPGILVLEGASVLNPGPVALLREGGFNVYGAATADDAAGVIAERRPDLVLLDIAWAGTSGFEVCGELRTTELGRRVPIVLYGASLHGDAMARGLLSGADDCVELPGRPGEFLARVRVQLRNKRDRDQLRRVQQERDRYRRAAYRDPLTGLANRRAIDLALARAMAEGIRFAVVFVDIDHFKRVNDERGHDVGDEVLSVVSLALTHDLRTDDVAARYGGEEFLVLLLDTDAAGAGEAAERLRAAVEATRPSALRGDTITASLGVAAMDPARPDASVESLCQRADAALYEAKRAGRNRVVMAEPLSLIPRPPAVPAFRFSRPPENPAPPPASLGRIEAGLRKELGTGRAGVPVLPAAAAEALHLAENPRTDMARIAALVERDPALAARFVAIAGSAAYSRGATVRSTHAALVRIGLAASRDLLLQVVYERTTRELPRYQALVARSFARSVRTAIAARAMAREFGGGYEFAYLCGLLHDLGESRVYRVLAHLPDAPSDGDAVADLVDRYHGMAGAGVVEAWGLPRDLVEVCRDHHGPPGTASNPVRLVMAADAMIDLIDTGSAVDGPSLAALLRVGLDSARVPALVQAVTVALEAVEAPAP